MSAAGERQKAPAQAGRDLRRWQSDLASLMELTRSLASREDIFDILFSVVKRLTDLLDVDRGSIVLRDERDEDAGIVVATSDDATMRNRKLRLDDYPEIRRVFSSDSPVIIDDVNESPLLDEVLSGQKDILFASMALIPIVGDDRTLATLVLKRKERAEFDDYFLMNAQAIANATAIALNNASTVRKLRDDSRAARELTETKEFLELVIESSVDGIVSADLKGNVLLYNTAAGRLFGYQPDEVFGKLTVDKLYPEGVARDIMRRIRRPGHGGEGRLEEFRVNMLTKSGEEVPVNLSASLVQGSSGPVGTVGIFTDVSEKLVMERQLNLAQEQLEERRRTDAIAEVAGAAAHELNQPLTSVMGYAEYLKRRLADDQVLVHAVEVILSETQRMADIVRKVGRITRYETKPYVGKAKIVDIDASSENSGSGTS